MVKLSGILQDKEKLKMLAVLIDEYITQKAFYLSAYEFRLKRIKLTDKFLYIYITSNFKAESLLIEKFYNTVKTMLVDIEDILEDFLESVFDISVDEVFSEAYVEDIKSESTSNEPVDTNTENINSTNKENNKTWHVELKYSYGIVVNIKDSFGSSRKKKR